MLALLMVAAGAAVTASAAELPATVDASIRAALKARIPALTVSELHTTPLPGIYEVLAPDGIVYTDASAEHVIKGEILETRSGRNLTAERWTEVNSIDFSSLPFAQAIKVVHGRGTREIAVFSDPKCPYCRELETELARLDDVTVYTFLYPLEDLHPGATQRAHDLWCAPDRAGAWSEWMLKSKAPAPTSGCGSDPIGALATYGAKLHINTTPTIFFRSGRRSSGLPQREEFERLLKAESIAVAAANASAATPGS
jgi:thiol:disulfide interchange protein DsbC